MSLEFRPMKKEPIEEIKTVLTITVMTISEYNPPLGTLADIAICAIIAAANPLGSMIVKIFLFSFIIGFFKEEIITSKNLPNNKIRDRTIP